MTEARYRNREKGPAPGVPVGLRLSTRQVTWALVLLWAAAAAITAPMVAAGHAMEPMHWAPVGILTLVLATWPFALGWRPLTPKAQRLRTCEECGTQWRPADEGTQHCPACGA